MIWTEKENGEKDDSGKDATQVREQGTYKTGKTIQSREKDKVGKDKRDLPHPVVFILGED